MLQIKLTKSLLDLTASSSFWRKSSRATYQFQKMNLKNYRDSSKKAFLSIISAYSEKPILLMSVPDAQFQKIYI